MHPDQLECELIDKLNALPPTENRLLYDIDYDEKLVSYSLRFLKNQNRLVRNTIWLHGGLPSGHWNSFFERVLMNVDNALDNLDELLNPPTPKTIKRFFEHCGDSARTILAIIWNAFSEKQSPFYQLFHHESDGSLKLKYDYIRLIPLYRGDTYYQCIKSKIITHRNVAGVSPIFRYDSTVQKRILGQNPDELDGLIKSFVRETFVQTHELFQFLNDKPKKVAEVVQQIVPDKLRAELCGDDNWKWLPELIGINPENSELDGLLIKFAIEFYGTIAQLKLRKRVLSESNKKSDFLLDTINTFEGRQFLSEAARFGILPKYGFPVDVVRLDTKENQTQEAKELDLQRDLKVAISEYAPESEVVARKKIWTSWGVKIVPGKKLERRCFRVCADCGRYESTVYIDDNKNDNEERSAWRKNQCSGCGSTNFKIDSKFIFPEFGFIAKKESKGFTGRRPERTYASRVYFAEDGAPLQTKKVQLNGATLQFQSSANSKLGVINQSAFFICTVYGYGALNSKENQHKNQSGSECKGHLNRLYLGHEFRTDIVKIDIPQYSYKERPFLRSVLYALIEGMSNALDIARTDLDGCLYFNNTEASLIIYDNVPGGAGHVRRLTDEDGIIEEVLQEAYRIVKHCKCGGESGDAACYACLQNYNNQFYHDELKRKYAIDFFEQIGVGKMSVIEEKVEEKV